MNDYRDILERLRALTGDKNILINEPMKHHTWFKIGGCADVMVIPENAWTFVSIIKLCRAEDVPCFFMGNGSNLLVSDKGIRGVVIKTHSGLSKVIVDNHILDGQSGVLLSELADIALENSLTGFEFASGIPGTLGGAVVMNAGAYGSEMKNVVIETSYMDEYNQIRIVTGAEHQFGYRSSIFQGSDKFIISSKIRLQQGEKSQIKAKMDDFNRRRNEKQPLELPSSGSTFRRPEGYYAGKLIEDCGLKGYSIGGAQVSVKHSGFIVNRGNATAEDVISLIEHVQKTVEQKFGVKLETEVKFIGEK